jgi:hypothetical protein
VRKKSSHDVTTCLGGFFFLARNAAAGILLLRPTSLHLFLIHGRPEAPRRPLCLKQPGVRRHDVANLMQMMSAAASYLL